MRQIRTWLFRVGVHDRLCRAWGRARGSEKWTRRELEVAFYRQFVSPGEVVYDIGAYTGEKTAVFRQLGARVIAVEPQRAFIQALHRRFRRDPGVRIVHTALSDTEGFSEMITSQYGDTSSLSAQWVERVKAAGRLPDHRWEGRETVPLRRFDDLIAAHGLPRFAKIDVEGFEDHVLAGLAHAIPAMSFELTREYLEAAQGAFKRVAALGDYEFNWSPIHETTLRLGAWLGAEAFGDQLDGWVAAGRPAKADIYARLRGT